MPHAPLGAVLGALLLAAPPSLAEGDPLLLPWTGPCGGVPPFDRVRVELLLPALETGIARQLAEVEAIATDPAPPTFPNTLVPLERSTVDPGIGPLMRKRGFPVPATGRAPAGGKAGAPAP